MPRRGDVPKRARVSTVNITFLNPAHKTKFVQIKHRTVALTRFFHIPTLHELGIYQGVHFLLQKGGLHGFLQKDDMTFRKTTLEFLASVEKCQVEGEEGISFQMNRQMRYMTYRQVAAAFGWMLPEGEWNPPNDNECTLLWFHLSGQVYSGSRSPKLNSVAHPCFRLVFRMILMNIMGYGEPGTIRTPQLGLFWPLCPEGNSVPNYVDIFINRCHALLGEKGPIGCGGMVTLLARALDVQLTENEMQVAPDSITSYDVAHLKQIGFMRFSSDSPPIYYLLVAGAMSQRIPPFPATMYHIAPEHDTHDCALVVISTERLCSEVSAAATALDEQEADEEDDEDFNYAEASGSRDYGDDPWRGQVDMRLTRMETDIRQVRDSVHSLDQSMQRRWDAIDARQVELQTTLVSRFEQLFTFMGPQYDHSGTVSQETPLSQDEMRRMYEEQRRRHPGDYQGFPGSGPGPSGC